MEIKANPNRNMPLSKGIGVSRDKTNDFLIIKNRLASIRDPSLR